MLYTTVGLLLCALCMHGRCRQGKHAVDSVLSWPELTGSHQKADILTLRTILYQSILCIYSYSIKNLPNDLWGNV